MSAEENTPSLPGPAIPHTSWRDAGWIVTRAVLTGLLIIIAVAIFIYDFFLYDKINAPPPAPPPVFRNMSSSVIQASSSFQSLISTICWIGGIGFAASGCSRLYRAMRYSYGTPDFLLLRRRARAYITLGLFFIAFPFVQMAMQGRITCPPNTYYYRAYQCPPDTAGLRDNLTLLAVVCCYLGAIAFFSGSLALKRAQQMKDDPGAPALKDKAAFHFAAGFILTALPFACASFMGVKLW